VIESERVLSLDISTKTGWAVVSSDPLKSFIIEAYGKVEAIHEPKGEYPERVLLWAHACFTEIKSLIELYKPTVLAIEQTSKGSKASKTQKVLEWIHFLVASYIADNNMKSSYLQTGEWRSLSGTQMTKEEKEKNKFVRGQIKEYKKGHEQEFVTGKDGKKRKKAIVVYGEDGKRIGKVGKKNVSVRRANELFGKHLKKELLRKDEDVAEAMLIAYAYHVRRNQSEIQNSEGN
jgi:Holliday junction resolvasome RuvABC endonuclease subunit